jgi:hypothetical protein
MMRYYGGRTGWLPVIKFTTKADFERVFTLPMAEARRIASLVCPR